MTKTADVEPLVLENDCKADSEADERAFFLWLLEVKFISVPENLVSRISNFTLPQLELAIKNAMLARTLVEFARWLPPVTSNA